jgi:hypothetical protein
MTDPAVRATLREMLIKAKFYRFASIIFALVGVGLLGVLMSQYVNDDILGALKDPFIILILIVPFLPALVLSWMAAKAEKKFNAKLETLDKAS